MGGRFSHLHLRGEAGFRVSPSSLYVFDGQSNVLYPTIAQSYPTKFRADAHPTNDLRHAAIGGTTYAEREVTAPDRVDWWMDTAADVVLVDDGMEEELRDGQDATFILNAISAYTTARRAARPDITIVGLTTPPATTAWWTAGQDTVRQTVNAAILANPATYGYDQVVDVAGIPELADPSNTTYFSDGIHFTDAATTLVAAELVEAGI